MEENKYYVPEIDEFYVGFEFEEWENTAFTNEEWIAKKIDYFTNLEYVCIPEIDKHLEDYVLGTSLFRVKYLDKEDLIELGFKPDPSGERYYEFNEYQLYVDIHPDFNITIYNDDPIIIFRGSIKNKSELIKVLKMLGIK